MIHPSATAIANIPPYKRIELGAKPKKPEPKWVPFAPMIWDDCEMRMVPDPKYAHPFY